MGWYGCITHGDLTFACGPHNRLVENRRLADSKLQDAAALHEITAGNGGLGVPVQLPRMLIARDATTRIVASEIKLSNIISSFARGVIGNASVGLNAVAVQKARKR